jgi:hypothetical protein
MKRQRTIVSTLALLAGLGACAPGTALAGAPLLSGYGGPGAGAQTIVGAALVNGPGGGSGGGSSGGGSAGSGSAGAGSELAGRSGAESRSTRNSRSASANSKRAGGASGRASDPRTAVNGTGTNPRATGANPNRSHLVTSAAVTANDAGTSWFSGADLLALVLAAGVLALVAVATVRLTRVEHG